MKKAVIIAVSVAVVAILGVFGYFVYNRHVKANAPISSEKIIVVVNKVKYTAKSSTPEDGFLFIKESEDFERSPLVIKKSVKHDEIPTEDLTTNFSEIIDNEIYVSKKNTNEIYIKTSINGDIRYYRFVKDGATSSSKAVASDKSSSAKDESKPS